MHTDGLKTLPGTP